MTSRLSGLRNLLFVLGVKDAPPPADPDDDDGGHRANLNTPAEDQGEVGGASRRHGTAPPEFLPPRPVVLEFEKTDPRSGDPLARLDRRDPKARVEILPSRRGQYRKG
jgi:hypothetical protein